MPTSRQTPPPALPGWNYQTYFAEQLAKISDQQQHPAGERLKQAQTWWPASLRSSLMPATGSKLPAFQTSLSVPTTV